MLKLKKDKVMSGKQLFIVKARNRLTGQREIVSNPVIKIEAERIRFEYTNIRGTRKPYTHPKVEPYVVQTELF